MIDSDVKRFLEIVEGMPGVDHQHWKNRLEACERAISNLSKELRTEQALKEAILIARKRAGLDLPSEYSDIYLGE